MGELSFSSGREGAAGEIMTEDVLFRFSVWSGGILSFLSLSLFVFFLFLCAQYFFRHIEALVVSCPEMLYLYTGICIYSFFRTSSQNCFSIFRGENWAFWWAFLTEIEVYVDHKFLILLQFRLPPLSFYFPPFSWMVVGEMNSWWMYRAAQ